MIVPLADPNADSAMSSGIAATTKGGKTLRAKSTPMVVVVSTSLGGSAAKYAIFTKK